MLSSRTRIVQRKRMSLQLTSLLDMFTIILVFLMVSFQAEDKDFVLHAGLELPASSAKNPFKTGVNLAITAESVVVEGQRVHELEEGGAVTEAELDSGNLEAVGAAISQAWDQAKKEADDEQIVVIQADRKIPYRTIHLVMRSAAHAGFYRFRLVIEKE